MEEKLTYEAPDFEVLNLFESVCVNNESGDGTVIGPGEEIPD